jgi:hypothetical protein
MIRDSSALRCGLDFSQKTKSSFALNNMVGRTLRCAMTLRNGWRKKGARLYDQRLEQQHWKCCSRQQNGSFQLPLSKTKTVFEFLLAVRSISSSIRINFSVV